MILFALLLIFLALPLFLIAALGGKSSPLQIRLGLLMVGVAVLIIILVRVGILL